MREQIILADILKGKAEFKKIALEVIYDEDRRSEIGC